LALPLTKMQFRNDEAIKDYWLKVSMAGELNRNLYQSANE